MRYLIFLSAALFMLISCKKVEGPGGRATIKGKLKIIEVDSGGNIMFEYNAPHYDVYIIYGDDPEKTYFDDDIKTSYDGTFEFNYLEKGDYRVFYYEDLTFAEMAAQTTIPYTDTEEAVIQSVTISDKKETVDLGTITVYKRY